MVVRVRTGDGDSVNNRPRYQPSYLSERQRVVLLTFESPEAAQAWDRDGRPLPGIVDYEATDPFVRCARGISGSDAHGWDRAVVGERCRCGARVWEGSDRARV